MPAARSRSRHLVVPLVLVLVFVFIVAGTVVALNRFGTGGASGTCVASGLGTTHRYSSEQTGNAALIAAVAVDRSLPPRAASIALATAYQESKLENIDHGDRDSLGLFQQRPSQDWGTEEEVMDPLHAANAFYDALVKIPGYQSMSLNDAAQKVQRSGYPEAYADHETEGRIYASALTGRSGANLVCDLDRADGAGSPEQVRSDLESNLPRRTADGTVSTPLVAASSAAGEVPEGAGATALVIDVHGDEHLGWALANWSVARAGTDQIVSVSYQGRTWDRAAADQQEPGSWATSSAGMTDRVVVLVSGS